MIYTLERKRTRLCKYAQSTQNTRKIYEEKFEINGRKFIETGYRNR